MSRHCRTEWNETGRLQGTVDNPLSREGIFQAQSIASSLGDLGITRVVTSPQQRALQTGAIYASRLSVPISSEVGLRELDHGAWEGRSLADLASNDDQYSRWIQDPGQVGIPMGSETVQAAQKRACDAILAIVDEYSDERVLVVSHKHLLALLRCALAGLDFSAFAQQVVEDVRPWWVDRDQIERIRS